ncbi:MAG: hypothetical protein II923_00455, partial [Campylobacter sp.]|nr:hypothetical protein [Campylobacter sp.]
KNSKTPQIAGICSLNLSGMFRHSERNKVKRRILKAMRKSKIANLSKYSLFFLTSLEMAPNSSFQAFAKL